jgi:hypothetical protein
MEFAAQHRGPGETLHRRVQLVRQIGTDGEGLAARQDSPLHRKTVLRQRAGLVAGDHRAGAEPLDGSERAHHHVPPRHAVSGNSQSH